MDNLPLSPESMLITFNKKMNNLFKSCLMFQNEDIDTGFKNLVRKTVVSEIMYNRYVIAISGLQGVGKSTLLKMMYDIPEGYIPEILGIGEKLPILITEHKENNYLCQAKKFHKETTGQYSIIDVVINKEDFYKAAMNPTSDYVFLELLVPFKYFNNSSQSFMLLPGVEQSHDSWNSLVTHALYCASTCILTFNENKFADGDNEKLVNKIQKEFEKANPIIALTFSDQSKDNNCELKKQVMERFSIPGYESDRIVRTGTNDDLKEKWIDELISAIRKYSPVEKEFRKNQIDVLDSIITQDLQSLITLIKEEAYSYKADRLYSKNAEVETIMKKIKDEQDKLIKEYKRVLQRQLVTFADGAVKFVDQSIIQTNFFKKLLGNITGQSFKEYRSFIENVENAWNQANSSGYQNLPSEIIYEVIANKFPLFESQEIDNNSYAAEQEVAVTSVEGTSYNSQRKDIVESMRALFVSDSNNNVPKNAMDSVKYIPVLALEMIRIKEIARGVEGIYNPADAICLPQNSIEVLMDHLGYANKQTGNLLKGIGLLLGLDSIDGTIDSIPAILNALGIEVTGAAASASVVAFGAIGLTVMTANIIAQINKGDFQAADYARKIINIIKEDYESRYIDSFLDAMDRIYDILNDKINICFHTNEEQSRIIGFQKSLSDIQSFSTEIRGIINENRLHLV